MQLQSNHTSRATNILTCLILSYTALQNIQALTSGDYNSGAEGMPHLKKSLSKFLCTPTTGCRALGIRCAEGSTHMRPTTSNSKTCSRATIPICTAANVFKLRYFNISLPPEKGWSLTIPKCTTAKIQYDVNDNKVLTTSKPLTNSTAERKTWWPFFLPRLFNNYYLMVWQLELFPEDGSVSSCRKLIHTTTIPISTASQAQKYNFPYSSFRLDFLMPSSGKLQLVSP